MCGCALGTSEASALIATSRFKEEKKESTHNILSPPKGMCGVSHDLLKFWETSDNISSVVQDRDIVAMEH